VVRIFKVFIPIATLTLLISEVILISAMFSLAAYLEVQDPLLYLVDKGVLSIGLVVLSIVAGLYLHDRYSDVLVDSKVLLLQQLAIVMGGAFLVQALVSYVYRDLRMSLHMMLVGTALAVPAIYGWRLLFSAYALQVMGGDRLLLVGTSALLQDMSRHIREHPEKGLRVIGFLEDGKAANDFPGGKYLGGFDALREVVAASHPTRIVVGMAERRNRMPVADLLDLRFGGNIIEEAATAYERVCGRVPVKELRPSQLIYSGDTGGFRRAELYQKTTNMVAAVLGVALTWPLMLLTALAVRLSSAGPVLYRQVRVGAAGKLFTLYKFRSMRADAEADTGAVWACKDDPRITPVGRVIRKLRLDELPQLFNVLKGEMSIVGPRPERPEFVQTLTEQIPYYRQRHVVRPGITGWAQISYKYGDTLEDTITKLEYDLYYIQHMSFSLDVYIIFHTLKAMLLSRGAQ
jgi:sugar transferase (PEP-CTERM system associated)